MIKLYIKTEVVNSAHGFARVGVAPVKISVDEVEVDVIYGEENIYYELPPCFDIERLTLVKDVSWESEFALVIDRAENGDSANWFWDCVCLDVTLEPHELKWFD